MAARTQCDQVLVVVVPLVTSETRVVNMKIGLRTTNLASPAIALQHTLAQMLVRLVVKPNAGLLRLESLHDAFLSSMSSRNVCRCSDDRNRTSWKSDRNKVSGFPLSRLAPAKKSAQIISRQ